MIDLMKKMLRYSITVSLLLVLFMNCSAADTIRINLISKHRLNEKGQTTGARTISQQFYNPDGIFFREVNYDENTSQIKNYVFRFYKDERLSTEECYNANDTLLYILRHTYSPAGDEILTEKMVPSVNHTLALAEKTIKTFDKYHRLISLKKYYGKKTGAISQFIYNADGLLISEKNTFKQSAKADVKQEIKQYSYNDDRKIRQVLISGKDNSGKAIASRKDYLYENGLLSSVKEFTGDNAPVGEKKYKYLHSGALSIYEEHDSTGHLTLLLQYEYKKHYMEIGTQKSYYESL
jgi:hypothetical protein